MPEDTELASEGKPKQVYLIQDSGYQGLRKRLVFNTDKVPFSSPLLLPWGVSLLLSPAQALRLTHCVTSGKAVALSGPWLPTWDLGAWNSRLLQPPPPSPFQAKLPNCLAGPSGALLPTGN